MLFLTVLTCGDLCSPQAAFWYGELRWQSLLVLSVWAGIGALLTARTFKWE